jgi:hypothetical protein
MDSQEVAEYVDRDFCILHPVSPSGIVFEP